MIKKYSKIHFVTKMYIVVYILYVYLWRITTILYTNLEKAAKKVKEYMTVPVQVHPMIREFIIDTTGSDMIVPEKTSHLWDIVKHNLELPPENYHAPETKDNLIYIALLDTSHLRTVVKNSDKTIVINTLFRWYLSADAQGTIAKHFRQQFKHTFHCFMQGAIANNPKLEQRQAMENFCKLYNLTLNELSEDMLKKSWDRSDHKQMVVKRKFTCCPLFF